MESQCNFCQNIVGADAVFCGECGSKIVKQANDGNPTPTSVESSPKPSYSSPMAHNLDHSPKNPSWPIYNQENQTSDRYLTPDPTSPQASRFQVQKVVEPAAYLYLIALLVPVLGFLFYNQYKEDHPSPANSFLLMAFLNALLVLGVIF